MRVKNLNGTAGHKCNCSSWLEHWENFSGQETDICAVKGCEKPPEVGGHVQRESNVDRAWYIIPLCKTCNSKRGQDLKIFNAIELVSANVSETCGK